MSSRATHRLISQHAPSLTAARSALYRGMHYDILIKNGIVYDGSGASGMRADVGINGNRIAAIEPELSGRGFQVIDADGLAVTPGFIDIKTHSDFTLPINPRAESKVRQGVTTEIIGHCGFSVAPCLPDRVELLKDYLSPSAPWLPWPETFRDTR